MHKAPSDPGLPRRRRNRSPGLPRPDDTIAPLAPLPTDEPRIVPLAPEARVGRPPEIQIDWREFDKLCAICCTEEEIAEWFNCSTASIERACLAEYGRTFAEHAGIKRHRARTHLRRVQMQAALAGNVTMMIWLGKQLLGQSDRQEVTVEVIDDGIRAELARKLTQAIASRGADSILVEPDGAGSETPQQRLALLGATGTTRTAG